MSRNILNTVADKLPDWFVATPVGRSLVEQHKKEEHAARQVLVDQLAQRRRDLLATCDRHAQIIDPLDATVRALRVKQEQAERKLIEAQRARHGDIHQGESQIAALEHQLAATADPRIAAAEREILDRFDAARGSLYVSQGFEVGRNRYTGVAMMITRSNSLALERLSTAMATARAKFGELKTQNSADLGRAIGEILEPVEKCWATVTELDEPDEGPRAA